MEKTKALLRELIRRDKYHDKGPTITDTDFKNVFREIYKYENFNKLWIGIFIGLSLAAIVIFITKLYV
jgi:ABC-type multidrug transport system permease subunit